MMIDEIYVVLIHYESFVEIDQEINRDILLDKHFHML
jgi:hypothetical protein